MKVVVKQWVPVAVWKWPNVDPNDDVCGICRAQFESTCPACLKPGAECPPAFGQCSHAFHKHCITTWLTRSTEHSCPMCRQPFVAQDSGELDAGIRESSILEGAVPDNLELDMSE